MTQKEVTEEAWAVLRQIPILNALDNEPGSMEYEIREVYSDATDVQIQKALNKLNSIIEKKSGYDWGVGDE